ncbi:MAG: TonB family protein [Candidatus Omnitrophica bacterium]|nr:TonB family protein [Candidatus Omnitrophota bacterium]MCM8803209.1 TonB family protein [Candidatus Omnitrophota bacterium]
MKINYIFLRAILVSLFFHLFGLSIFSIILPLPLKRTKPIEIIIYPSSETKSPEKRNILISKKVREYIGMEKVKPEEDFVSLNISSKEAIDEKEYITPVKLDIDIEKLEEKEINISSFPVLNVVQESPSEVSIEGPAGTRKILYKEKIDYPLSAQKKGMEGKVKIKFWVNPEGKVSNTEIIFSSGSPEIDFYAEARFKNWLFEPVKTEKDVWGIITLIFKLK